MRLLVLGGTRFIGRAIVEAALRTGHEVTISNRGRSEPEAFGGDVEHLPADRDVVGAGGLADAVGTRRWDAVVDANGYVTEVVAASCAVLADRVERYAFVSTGSVYQHPLPVGADEDSPQLDEAPPGTTDVDAHYGPLKVACERVVRETFGDRASIVRPGIVFGAHDYTDRATWWVRMAARTPALVVPDGPEAWTQLVDARDLADFTLHTLEQSLPGPYNVVGTPINLQDLAHLAVRATGSRAEVHAVPARDLLAAGVEHHTDLPLWIAAKDATFKRRSHARAANDGLQLRPVVDTLAQIAAWDAGRDEPLATGMSQERMAEVLAAVG